MKIEKNISLKDKNWFKTGGCAQFYTEPQTAKEFQESVEFANKNNLKIEVLGEGANSLISDKGFDGLIIRPKINSIKRLSSKRLITVGSGQTIQETIDWTLKNNLTGLEEFSGIPGTIGGAVYINAHYFHFLISQFLVSADVISKQTGEISSVDKKWFDFGYDHSKLFEKNFFVGGFHPLPEPRHNYDIKADTAL